MSNEFFFSEDFRLAAEQWVDLEYAASLLEETKSSVMAQRQAALGDIPVNRAEQIVKASPEWKAYVEGIVGARREANKAKVIMEFKKLRYYEAQSMSANARAEMRL